MVKLAFILDCPSKTGLTAHCNSQPAISYNTEDLSQREGKVGQGEGVFFVGGGGRGGEWGI